MWKLQGAAKIKQLRKKPKENTHNEIKITRIGIWHIRGIKKKKQWIKETIKHKIKILRVT